MNRFIAAMAVLYAGCHPNPARMPHGPVPHPTDGAARVHLIDVGQGACTLVEFPCGAMLVDTGGEANHLFDGGKQLQAYLDRFFARRTDLDRTIDLLVLTHPHIDHTRGAQLVAENFRVKNVVTDGIRSGSGGKEQTWLEEWASRNARLETIRSEDVPPGGKTSPIIDPIACHPVDPTITVLWGSVASKPERWQDRAFGNQNNHRGVIRIDHGRASLIINGDLEETGIDSLLERHRSTSVLDADLWQVGHHGSYNATTIPLLAALTPRIALIGMGAPDRWAQWTAWKYGHPRKKAIDMLIGSISDPRDPVEVLVGTGVETFERIRLDKAIYGTGWDGSVVVTATPDGRYRVETEHPVRATVGPIGPNAP